VACLAAVQPPEPPAMPALQVPALSSAARGTLLEDGLKLTPGWRFKRVLRRALAWGTRCTTHDAYKRL